MFCQFQRIFSHLDCPGIEHCRHPAAVWCVSSMREVLIEEETPGIEVRAPASIVSLLKNSLSCIAFSPAVVAFFVLATKSGTCLFDLSLTGFYVTNVLEFGGEGESFEVR